MVIILLNNHQEIKPLIDPTELKGLFQELIVTNNKLDQMALDNKKFFDKLFDDGAFEPWLRANNFVLSQKELDFVID